jgi:hypothetical protein
MPDPDPLDLGANLLWSWLTQARRIWATEDDCIAALKRFGGYLEGCDDEQARATITVGVAKKLLVINDERAEFHYRRSLGYDIPEDLVVVRAVTPNDPAPLEG